MINEADSFADKVERHRRAVMSQAADYIKSFRDGAEEKGVTFCEFDVYAISQGCINAAEEEWRAGFLKPSDAEDRRALPDYRRPL